MIVANGFEAKNIEELMAKMVKAYSERYIQAVNALTVISDDGSEESLSVEAVRMFDQMMNDEIAIIHKERRTEEDNRLDRMYSERGDR